MENPVEVGKFGAVFGVNGWIKVHSFTERLESIFEYQPWFIKEQGEWCEIQISEWKHHGNGLIVKLVGIDQREIAQQKTNLSIFVEESVLPELPDGEYYINDLMGATVYNEQNYNLGEITDFFETGANEVLVLKAEKDDEYGRIKCEHNVATCLLNGAMHFAYRKPGEEIIKSEVPLHICKNCKNTYYYLPNDSYKYDNKYKLEL